VDVVRAMRLGLAALFGVALSYTDSNTVKGVTYYYEVTAVNSFGEGPRSNELSARAATEPPATTTTTTTTPGATVPDAPTLDSAVAHDWGVGLAWSAPASDGGSAVTGYRIYRGIASGAEQSLTGIPNYETASDSSTVNGTTYYYEVSA